MRALSLLALVGLVGCVSAGPQTASAPVARVGVDFVPDAQGLGIEGSTKRIDFGRAPSGVVSTLNRELGRSSTLSLANCPSGVVQQVAWDDLVLTFTRERFVGWKTSQSRAGQTCA